MLDKVSVWADDGKTLNVVIETPRGCRNKYSFDEETGLFKLGGPLPLGHTFPFDFGFVPHTKGGDGDPLDVLVLMDEPGFPACLVECRLIGGLKAFQTESGGERERNDRLLAIAKKSTEYTEVRTLADLDRKVLDQIRHFFISYNEAKGKRFEIERRLDAKAAAAVVERATV